MKDILYDFKKIFLEYPEVKAIIGMVAISLSWTFNGEYQALIAIFSLVILDFMVGTHGAIVRGEWSSRRSLAGVGKFGRYLSYMFVARMVDKVVPLPFASPLMDTYIVVTEAGSILESFQKQGCPVPTMLLTKLKAFYDKKGNNAEK